MNLKKTVAALLVVVVTTGMLGVSAFAHCGGTDSKAAASGRSYEVCAQADCTLTGIHQHNGKSYCAQGQNGNANCGRNNGGRGCC